MKTILKYTSLCAAALCCGTVFTLSAQKESNDEYTRTGNFKAPDTATEQKAAPKKAAPKKAAPKKAAPKKAAVAAKGMNAMEFRKITNDIISRNSTRIQNTDIINYNGAQIQKEYYELLDNPELNDNQRMDVLQMIAINAQRLNEKAYNEAMEKLLAFADSPQKSAKMVAIINHYIKQKRQWSIKRADALFRSQFDKFDANQKINVLSQFATCALSVENNREKFDSLLAEIFAIDVPADATDRFKKTVQGSKDRAIENAVMAMIRFNDEEGTILFNKYLKGFNEKQIITFRKEFATMAINAKNRQAFDDQLDAIRKFPFSPAKAAAFIELARKVLASSRFVTDALLDEVYGWKESTADIKFQVLLAKRAAAGCAPGFTYGTYRPGSYEEARDATQKMAEFLAKNEVKDKRSLNEFYGGSLDLYWGFGDYALFEDTLTKAIAYNPASVEYQKHALRNALRKNDSKNAVALIDHLQTFKLSKGDREMFAVLKFFVNGGKYDDFDKAFAENKYSSAQKLGILRDTSRFFFQSKQFDTARMIHTNNMEKMFKAPAVGRTYTVEFVDDAPKTADSWAKSAYYNAWDKMETRFMPYNAYDVNGSDDMKHFLKDAPEIKLNDDYRSGVHVLAEPNGVHIFVRSNDPAIADVVLGKRNGISLEQLIRPHDDRAYHSWYFNNLPDTADPTFVNWATPSPLYRYTYDYMKKDAVLTKDGYVAHTYIPWLMFYDNLPVNGHKWKYGIQVWGGAATRTLSGMVHELSRAILLDFKMTPAQVEKLKGTIAIQIYNRYRKIREDRGDVVRIWEDPVLGDVAFWDAVVKPLVDELDAAGKDLLAAKSDAEAAKFFDKYAPVWAEIGYVIAGKRSAYLSKKLLEE